jgi:hypothetical protein
LLTRERAALNRLRAFFDERIDGRRRDLPAAADLEGSNAPGGDELPCRRVVDAEQRRGLAKIEIG